MDTFSQKIADKMADNVPGTILVTLDSKKLSLNIDTHALIVQQHDANSGELILDGTKIIMSWINNICHQG